MLGLTVPSVNNHLQRARRRLSEIAPTIDSTPPDRRREADAAEACAQAFIQADMDTLTRLLHHDVTLEMPPIATWLRGRRDVSAFLAPRLETFPWRSVFTRVNTQSTVVLCTLVKKEWLIESVHILNLTGGAVSGIIIYRDNSTLRRLALPPNLAPGT